MSNSQFAVVIAVEVAVTAPVLIWLWYNARKWKAEIKWREHPDPAAVEAQRQLYEAGEFRRKIMSWAPRDLYTDRGELECGHYVLNYKREEKPEYDDCTSCASEFLAKARLTIGKR